MAGGEDHLIPVMNLMVILIPFLIKMAVFVTTVTLQVTLPPRAAGGSGSAGGVQQTLLMVGVHPSKGFLITNDRGFLPWIPLKDGRYDYDQLQMVLKEDVKDAIPIYSDHEEIYLAIPDEVPFYEVVTLMDTVRGDLREEQIESVADAQKWGVEFQPNQDQSVYVAELFPSVIFGGAVPQ